MGTPVMGSRASPLRWLTFLMGREGLEDSGAGLNGALPVVGAVDALHMGEWCRAGTPYREGPLQVP